MGAPGKRYLGDGAFVAFDGYAFVLTAENGISATDTIVLEREHIADLVRFVEECTAAARKVGDLPEWLPPAAEIQQLRQQLREAREHAEALDANWSRLHAATIDSLRAALGIDGTVPEMCAEITRIRDWAALIAKQSSFVPPVVA